MPENSIVALTRDDAPGPGADGCPHTRVLDSVAPRVGGKVARSAEVLVGRPVRTISVTDELTKLAKLRDAGVLSDSEFETQKARLLK